jgi:hypothetical protein
MSNYVFTRTITPSSWNINIFKEGDEYKLSYTEIVERPKYMSFEEFRSSFHTTVNIIKKVFKSYSIDADVDGYIVADKGEIVVNVRGRLSDIASIIVMGFLSFSNVGQITIKELLVLSSFISKDLVKEAIR